LSRPPRPLGERDVEFLPLSDAAARAVSGPNSRHAALLENGFHVLIETPGGGVSLRGDSREREGARRAVEALAKRADAGVEVTEADVRVAMGAVRTGERTAAGGAALPFGRRGPVAPKTAAQARYLEQLAANELVFGVGRRARARPSWPLRTAPPCSCAARSIGW
jgi:phosphate starvation-inducible PhoH-like protein